MERHKITRYVAFALLVCAIILEALPWGVSMEFAAPSGEKRPHEYFSYFDGVPFGYAFVFPLPAAVLTVLGALLAGASLRWYRLRFPAFLISVLAALLSLGVVIANARPTVLSWLVLILLLASAALLSPVGRRDAPPGRA